MTQLNQTNISEANSGGESTTSVLDSGATHHFVNDSRWFRDLKPASQVDKVVLGGFSYLKVKGCGTVLLAVKQNDEISELTLRDVLFVPRMRRNLVSLGALAEDSFKIITTSDTMYLQRKEFALSLIHI